MSRKNGLKMPTEGTTRPLENRREQPASGSAPVAEGQVFVSKGQPARYRVKRLCRVGRLREAGDVFTSEPILPCPDYLEVVTHDESQTEEELAPLASTSFVSTSIDLSATGASVDYAGISPADLFGKL